MVISGCTSFLLPFKPEILNLFGSAEYSSVGKFGAPVVLGALTVGLWRLPVEMAHEPWVQRPFGSPIPALSPWMCFVPESSWGLYQQIERRRLISERQQNVKSKSCLVLSGRKASRVAHQEKTIQLKWWLLWDMLGCCGCPHWRDGDEDDECYDLETGESINEYYLPGY
jgi:hypothetical protein